MAQSEGPKHDEAEAGRHLGKGWVKAPVIR
jgi:hypothetical protein